MDILVLVKLIVYFTAMSISVGLAFAILATPRRGGLNYTFAFFCFSLFGWSLVALLRALPPPLSQNNPLTLQIMLTFVLLHVQAFYLFTTILMPAPDRFWRSLTAFGLLLIVLAFGLVWGGLIYTLRADHSYSLNPLGYGLLITAVVYLGIAAWMILNSTDPSLSWLRLPSILIVVAYATNISEPLLLVPIDIFLHTVACISMGWVVLQFRVFNPQQELNKELQTANRDLQQAVQQLATEKTRVEKLNQELEQTSRYKTEFMANMSHELRTPLNSIIGYSELLRSNLYGDLTPRQIDRLERIHQNGKHLSEMIDAILDFNKIESGKLEFKPEYFQWTELIEKVLQDREPLASDKGLNVYTRFAPQLPPIYGEPHRIQQIVYNLVDNAIKFTPQGSITLSLDLISVKSGRTDYALPAQGWLTDGDWLLLSIDDTGIGIPLEYQGRVFEQFSQADPSPTKEHGGIGLGLAITKRLVEMHQGRVWFKSKPLTGSTFYVALPVLKR